MKVKLNIPRRSKPVSKESTVHCGCGFLVRDVDFTGMLDKAVQHTQKSGHSVEINGKVFLKDIL